MRQQTNKQDKKLLSPLNCSSQSITSQEQESKTGSGHSGVTALAKQAMCASDFRTGGCGRVWIVRP